MTLVERAARAATSVSRHAAPGSGGDVGRPTVARLAVAAVWVALAKLAGLWLSGHPVLALLGSTSITFVTTGALFGWLGLAIAMPLQLVYVGLLMGGVGGVYPWATLLAYGVAGALAWMVFRYVPGLSRSFADLRTAVWFAFAGVLGAVLSSAVITATGGDVVDFWSDVAVWSRSTVVSVLVFAPPLIILGHRWLRPYLAVVPGEPERRRPRRIALVRGSGDARMQPIEVDVDEQRDGWVLLVAAVVCVAITVAKVSLSGGWGPEGAWFNLLYLALLWWVAQRLRLPGALLVAAMIAVGGLATRALAARHQPPLSASDVLTLFALMLAVTLFAALIGGAAEREGELLEGLADLHARLQEDLHRLLWALTGAVEAKDAYTGGHQQRVSAFALEVGRRLGLPARELEMLQVASMLHDIGKIGIPETILNKPGPLDEEEWRVMRRHCEIGAQLLQRVEGLREAAPLVLHHQERWDGRTDVPFPGYPTGIAGETIPIGARIIAVVDAFDAMTTDRPYRGAKSAPAARAVLLAERGAQFDARVVETFLRVLDELPWDPGPGTAAGERP